MVSRFILPPCSGQLLANAMPSYKSVAPCRRNHAVTSANVGAQVPEVQHDLDSACNCWPYMLLYPRTCSCAGRKQEAFGIGIFGTDGVKEVKGDGISPQEHQLMLLTFCSNGDVVCKCPGDTARRKHGFGPRNQHECNEGHGQVATLGDAHGMSVGLPEHACNRVVIDNFQVESAVGMPKLRWETPLKEHTAE